MSVFTLDDSSTPEFGPHRPRNHTKAVVSALLLANAGRALHNLKVLNNADTPPHPAWSTVPATAGSEAFDAITSHTVAPLAQDLKRVAATYAPNRDEFAKSREALDLSVHNWDALRDFLKGTSRTYDPHNTLAYTLDEEVIQRVEKQANITLRFIGADFENRGIWRFIQQNLPERHVAFVLRKKTVHFVAQHDYVHTYPYAHYPYRNGFEFDTDLQPEIKAAVYRHLIFFGVAMFLVDEPLIKGILPLPMYLAKHMRGLASVYLRTQFRRFIRNVAPQYAEKVPDIFLADDHGFDDTEEDEHENEEDDHISETLRVVSHKEAAQACLNRDDDEKEVVCPISQEPVGKNDALVMNGNGVCYSAVNLSNWIIHSKKGHDPITRKRYDQSARRLLAALAP